MKNPKERYGNQTRNKSKMEQLKSQNEHMFPTKTSFLIFWSYISLFVSQGLLVTAFQKSHVYGFNTAIVVLLTEFVKLIICVAVYLYRSQGGGLPALLYDIKANSKLLALYLVPAFLYCLYNNLTFINLQLFDLATYYCLMQFRIVLTAIIYQILFRRQLTKIQWVSLLILTLGCLIKEYGLYNNISGLNSPRQTPITTDSSTNTTDTNKSNLTVNPNQSSLSFSPIFKFFLSTLLLLFQMFCSCFAGVYNEFLLKDSSTARDADIILQNIFMYLDSMICNLIVFNVIPNSNPREKVEDTDLSTMLINLLTSPIVIVLILNNAFSGLVASFFLKSLNSILKTFASALELFVVTFLAWMLFNDNVDKHTVIALILVSVAMIIYSKNPVSVAPPGRTSPDRDGFTLLPTTEESYYK